MSQFNLVLPVGTQIVIKESTSSGKPSGSIAEIISSPTDNSHSYRIKFADGEELQISRSGFVIKRSEIEILQPEQYLQDFNLFDEVAYKCIVGSRAYGLAHEDSDTDVRGFYIPNAQLNWSIYGVPEQIEDKQNETCFWEIQKFLILALKANPNILECLYSPLVLYVNDSAKKVVENKQIFLSKLIYQTFNGYALSQFKKLEADLRTQKEMKRKHAMHLIRLLISGIKAMKEYLIPVQVEKYKEELLAIRDGTMAWQEIDKWRLSLHREFDAAYQRTTLPERPDYSIANQILISIRREQISD